MVPQIFNIIHYIPEIELIAFHDVYHFFLTALLANCIEGKNRG